MKVTEDMLKPGATCLSIVTGNTLEIQSVSGVYVKLKSLRTKESLTQMITVVLNNFKSGRYREFKPAHQEDIANLKVSDLIKGEKYVAYTRSGAWVLFSWGLYGKLLGGDTTGLRYVSDTPKLTNDDYHYCIRLATEEESAVLAEAVSVRNRNMSEAAEFTIGFYKKPESLKAFYAQFISKNPLNTNSKINTNEIHRENSEKSGEPIIGRAAIPSGGQSCAIGSRSQGNIPRTYTRKAQVRRAEICQKAVFA